MKRKTVDRLIQQAIFFISFAVGYLLRQPRPGDRR
jgi:hypothetical protein